MTVAHSIEDPQIPAALLPWIPMLDVWRSGQEGLPQVVRWSKYLTHGKGARRQDSLQHSYSLAIFGRMVLEKLQKYRAYDLDILLTAFLVHDHGEAELKEDLLYIDKNDDGDLNEYLAFGKRYAILDRETFERFELAFLLQFSGRERPNFPLHARERMIELKRSHPKEVLAFEAIERLDYLMYAIAQFRERGNIMILVQVLRNQAPHLERLTREVKGLDEFWTSDIAGWSATLLAEHADRWIEEKGQR